MNVFDRLSPTLQLILAHCKALGFDFAALLAGGAESLGQRFTQISSEFKSAGLDLKDILNGNFTSLKKVADIASTIQEATKQLQSELDAAQAKLALYETAIFAFGAKIVASDEKAGVTAADIEKALNDRASIKASDQLAAQGLKQPLGLTPAADPTNPQKKVEARTDADHLAHYESLEAGSKERREYGAKHYNAINRANNARISATG